MSCLQAILAIIFPPLAVINHGCGSMLIVFLLTLTVYKRIFYNVLIICLL